MLNKCIIQWLTINVTTRSLIGKNQIYIYFQWLMFWMSWSAVVREIAKKLCISMKCQEEKFTLTKLLLQSRHQFWSQFLHPEGLFINYVIQLEGGGCHNECLSFTLFHTFIINYEHLAYWLASVVYFNQQTGA